MPHFHSDAKTEECMRILELVPSHKLIVLDKYVAVWGQHTKLVYQDFRHDIYEALIQSGSLLKKYNNISLIFPERANHPKELIEGIEDFCLEHKMSFKIISEIENEALTKYSVYIPIEEDDLARLIKKMRRAKMCFGEDVGIISFNETVFKELLDITVFTTDFEAMGRTAADFILGKEKGAHRNPFYTIHRGSL
jgi:DNA-binding LacI/PurR family transcriptional regulator